MHGPNANSHGDRAAGQPCREASTFAGSHASRKIEGGIRRRNRNHSRKSDDKRIVGARQSRSRRNHLQRPLSLKLSWPGKLPRTTRSRGIKGFGLMQTPLKIGKPLYDGTRIDARGSLQCVEVPGTAVWWTIRQGSSGVKVLFVEYTVVGIAAPSCNPTTLPPGGS